MLTVRIWPENKSFVFVCLFVCLFVCFSVGGRILIVNMFYSFRFV